MNHVCIQYQVTFAIQIQVDKILYLPYIPQYQLSVATPSNHQPTAKPLLALNRPPHLHKVHGIGTPNTTANPANNVFPHPYPSTSYILGANNGKPNPARLRSMLTAPSADAA